MRASSASRDRTYGACSPLLRAKVPAGLREAAWKGEGNDARNNQRRLADIVAIGSAAGIGQAEAKLFAGQLTEPPTGVGEKVRVADGILVGAGGSEKPRGFAPYHRESARLSSKINEFCWCSAE